MKCLSWILVAALAVAPLAAQNTPVPQTDKQTTIQETQPVRTPILVPSRFVKPEGSFTQYIRHSTLLTPPPLPRRAAGQAPGESKWIILAGLMIAGGVVAAILLWPDHDGRSGPSGTIITAGNPNVTTPR